MTELHSRLLDMFEWFHNLCESENLTYFAQGGTVLGAVRHKGFIPWDDDVDVGMPRADYEKLREKAERINKNSRYIVEFPENGKYTYGFCKVYDTQTILIENVRGKIRRGVYLDIFPIDGIGNTFDESLKKFKKFDRYRDLFRIQSIEVNKRRSLCKNATVVFSRIILSCIYNKRKVLNLIEKNLRSADYNSCEYIVNFFGGWREKEIMKKKWVTEPILWEFEKIKIYIPMDYDAYLTNLYGNYMQLPPIEKRVSHHDYIYMNLNKSYLD